MRRFEKGTEAERGAAGVPEPELDDALCLSAHPLLEDVRCQRLQGHPGKHGAEVETRSAEIYLEWANEDIGAPV